jgi:ATP-binding cassette, subfamily B, bacterial
MDLANILWPADRLDEALAALCRASGLSRGVLPEAAPAPDWQQRELFDNWLTALAQRLDCQTQGVSFSMVDFERGLSLAVPALLAVPDEGETRFLALIGGRGHTALAIAPDFRKHKIPAEFLSALLCQLPAQQKSKLTGLLDRAALGSKDRSRVFAGLVGRQLGDKPVCQGWLLKLRDDASWPRRFWHAGLGRRLAVFLGCHVMESVLGLLSWSLIGQGALQGRFDPGWIAAWVLALFAVIPFHLLSASAAGGLAIGIGALLKERLLCGALNLKPERIRHEGVGQLLGRVLESQAVGSLAFGTGLIGIAAMLDLFLAGYVLAFGAGAWWLLLLLIVWSSLGVWFAWNYWRSLSNWTAARLELTNDLVERMAGHRTRLAQEHPQQWHRGEDPLLEKYHTASVAMDGRSLRTAVVPRGWLAAALLALIPGFVMGNAPPAALALSLGGILLAYQALMKLASALSSAAAAAIAFDKAALLIGAAGQTATAPLNALPVAHNNHATPGQTILDARDLVFRHADRGQATVNGCNLQIKRGDRLLLEGASGAGKSTLASLLAGLRQPDSGLLLLEGFDHWSLGLANWRRNVATAPQFHENHVLTGTFAFNLLMGRQWPPQPDDWQAALEVCQELGLDEVLKRMPAGLMQMVGETGWQLSHGEKSRLYIARALLQRSRLLIFDESFAALDPNTLLRALRCVLKRAHTLLVIAHP